MIMTGNCNSESKKSPGKKICLSWMTGQDFCEQSIVVLNSHSPLSTPKGAGGQYIIKSLSGESAVYIVTSCYWNWREDTDLMDYWGFNADLMCHFFLELQEIKNLPTDCW